jgi:N-acetylated-alpha-linked acidic dipeptidase
MARHPFYVLALAVVTSAVTAAPLTTTASDSPGILGFSPDHALVEHRVEERFLRLPSSKRARAWHELFTREPHPAASKRNNELADIVAAEWRREGWDEVHLRRYDVLHSEPRSVTLEMTAPTYFKAALREAAIPGDPSTANPRVSGAYFGYSASGDVTAELVYAHSGNPEDYAALKRAGIDVRGKVVIVRYSNPYSYRGFKALTAEREGAAALLIYSDPIDDGEGRGKVYPDGPWGPPTHIQRGAITYDYIVPGDPTTPGWASTPGAPHLKPEEARSLPKIIALPLSWADAQPLLAAMDGPEAPADWRGGMPITYRLSGAVKVHVHADMDTRIRPYTVVEARMYGAERPDEWVLIGNHRDAWAFGGVDPVSGTASLLDLTRSLGALKRAGLRPRRTLVACSWDGEEYALTGSTEWGEQFGEELKHKLVAYLNVDESVAGAATTAGPDGLALESTAVASLAPMLVEAAASVPSPVGGTLRDAWRKTTQKRLGRPIDDSDLVDPKIGSGSDHTVFLNHLGRPVINLGFTGDYGVYHSQYDDHAWMKTIGDPGFLYHTALTKLWGVTALRLANADLLPFDYAANAHTLEGFVDTLAQAHPDAPVDWERLRGRIREFGSASTALQTALAAGLPAGARSAARLDRLNHDLMQVESNWLDPAGIPDRPWFQHLLYAARYTYAHLELPGLTEAVEAGDGPAAQKEATRIELALERNTRLLTQTLERWRRP